MQWSTGTVHMVKILLWWTYPNNNNIVYVDGNVQGGCFKTSTELYFFEIFVFVFLSNSLFSTDDIRFESECKTLSSGHKFVSLTYKLTEIRSFKVNLVNFGKIAKWPNLTTQCSKLRRRLNLKLDVWSYIYYQNMK